MNLLRLLARQWDRATALALTLVGGVLLVAGYLGVSGTAVFAEQAPYFISFGLTAIFLLGIAATLWVSADLRDEWRKLDRIEQALGDGILRYDGSDEPSVGRPDLPIVTPEHRSIQAPTLADLPEPAVRDV